MRSRKLIIITALKHFGPVVWAERFIIASGLSRYIVTQDIYIHMINNIRNAEKDDFVKTNPKHQSFR